MLQSVPKTLAQQWGECVLHSGGVSVSFTTVGECVLHNSGVSVSFTTVGECVLHNSG